MEAQKNYNKIKNAKQEQVFIKNGETLKPVKLQDLKFESGKTVGELEQEHAKLLSMFALLELKMKNAGYEFKLEKLDYLEIVSRKKTAQKKLVKKLKDKGVI